jgi:hypothetical protein
MAAAIAGVISYTFGRWLRLGGKDALGPMIADALTALKAIDRAPADATPGSRPAGSTPHDSAEDCT